MLIFHFKDEDLTLFQKEENKKRIQQIVNDYWKADVKLEELCKELGIEKPKITCIKDEPILHG